MTINLGPDFPRTPEEIATREEIEELLENALYMIRYDPIGGNIRHNIERILVVMDEADKKDQAA